MASRSDLIITPNNLNEFENVREKLSEESIDLGNKAEKIRAGIFLTAVTCVATAIGFGTTVIAARKQDPKYFQQGMSGVRGMTETGASLAMRALGWGTVYAVSGCGILFYGIWKLSGATNGEEFKLAMGSLLPKIPKNNPPQSRTEFSGLNDLLKYVSEDWSKDKVKESK